MKRRIAAVLVADIAAPEPPAGEAPAGAARRDAAETVVASAVARGGGRMLSHPGSAPVAEFQSAVEAVRAAIDAQATLRARNKARPSDGQVAFRLAIAIGEVIDGEGDVPDETLDAASRLIGLAGPGGVCISRSVRDAVVSKLRLHMLDLTVEGARPDAEPPRTHAGSRPASGDIVTRLRALVRAAPRRALAAAAVAGLALAAVIARPGADPQPPPDTPHATALVPAAAPQAETRPGGTLEFMPAHAPDPSEVLTARRLLPQAWRDCHRASPDKAVAACKLLLDSGIAKGRELADIHVANARALRDRRELDKALASLDAAVRLAPTSAAYALRGTVHYDKGSADQAVADYSEAIRLDPQNGEAFNNRAWIHYRAGRTAEALADADVAVRLLARQAYAWDTRAHIHAALGNREAAISDFRAALAIDPQHAASRDGLASLGVN